MPWRTSVQHGIPSWMDPTSCYQKTDSTFYVKKTEKKLVSQNFEPLKSNIMLENSIFSSPFLLFTFFTIFEFAHFFGGGKEGDFLRLHPLRSPCFFMQQISPKSGIFQKTMKSMRFPALKKIATRKKVIAT